MERKGTKSQPEGRQRRPPTAKGTIYIYIYIWTAQGCAGKHAHTPFGCFTVDVTVKHRRPRALESLEYLAWLEIDTYTDIRWPYAPRPPHVCRLTKVGDGEGDDPTRCSTPCACPALQIFTAHIRDALNRILSGNLFGNRPQPQKYRPPAAPSPTEQCMPTLRKMWSLMGGSDCRHSTICCNSTSVASSSSPATWRSQRQSDKLDLLGGSNSGRVQ